jgi:hypothetical protein
MNNRIESYPLAGIKVMRGAVSREVIQHAHKESVRIHAVRQTMRSEIVTDKPNAVKGPVHQAHLRSSQLKGEGFTIISSLLESWYPGQPGIATINHQTGESRQSFHRDRFPSKPRIIHLNDGGAFDYILPTPRIIAPCNEPDFTSFETIEMNAGDVMEIGFPGLVHRVRNLTDAHRFNVGLYVDPNPAVFS